MPWAIRRRGSKWAVVKRSDGKVVGTHDDYAAAQAQQRALYANVDKEEKKK